MKLLVVDEPPRTEPCNPSPCGPNSECKAIGDSPSCICLAEFIGTPPNCRPECVSNSECANHLACINQKCKNPCATGICGQNAECRVVSHTPNCICVNNYVGNPFVHCQPPPRKLHFINIFILKILYIFNANSVSNISKVFSLGHILASLNFLLFNFRASNFGNNKSMFSVTMWAECTMSRTQQRRLLYLFA